MRGSGVYRVVVITIIAALMLHMWPMPNWLDYARPEWVVLVLIYWALATPEQIGVNVAWFVGLLLDVSQGAILGQHALGLVIVVYIIQLEYQRIRVYSLVQQAIVVLFLLLIKQALVLWVTGIVGQAPDLSVYFLPSLIGAMMWPWLFMLLRDVRRKFIVSNKRF